MSNQSNLWLAALVEDYAKSLPQFLLMRDGRIVAIEEDPRRLEYRAHLRELMQMALEQEYRERAIRLRAREATCNADTIPNE